MLKIYDENMKMLTIKFAPGSGSKLGHESRIYSVCYNKDLNFSGMMVTGGWDRNVLLYDIRASKNFLSFTIKNKNLNYIFFKFI